MKEQTRLEPKTFAVAERRMQAWARTQEIADRSLRLDQPQRSACCVGPYVGISREAGAGGSTVAEMLGRRLGWEVLDKGVLDQVADHFHLSRAGLEAVDETTMSWAYDIFGPWLDREIVSHEKYLSRLTRILLAAARRGKIVFVGRGAQFLLPRESGYAVRLIASEKYRIAQLAGRHDLSPAKARHLMHNLDRGRRQFVRHFFHQDIDDPHLYDLVLNVEQFGPEGTSDGIIRVLGLE